MFSFDRLGVHSLTTSFTRPDSRGFTSAVVASGG